MDEFFSWRFVYYFSVWCYGWWALYDVGWTAMLTSLSLRIVAKSWFVEALPIQSRWLLEKLAVSDRPMGNSLLLPDSIGFLLVADDFGSLRCEKKGDKNDWDYLRILNDVVRISGCWWCIIWPLLRSYGSPGWPILFASALSFCCFMTPSISS